MKMKLSRAIAFVLCPMLAMADVTLSENVTLTADADWRSQGVVTVPSGVTVDVNGHTLWLAGLAGGGSFTSSVASAPFVSLTSSGTGASVPDSSCLFSGTKASDAFTSTKRAIFNVPSLSYESPLCIDYDFGTATAVNMYRLTNHNDNLANERAPRNWTFHGSADGHNWTLLDTRENEIGWKNGEVRAYVFSNTTAYRHYRIRFTETELTTATYLQFRSLEYGHVGNQLRLDAANAAGFSTSSISVSSDVDVILHGCGAIPFSLDLRGLGKLTLDGTLDLAGFLIKVDAIDGVGTVTTSGEVPDGTTPLTGSGTYSACKDDGTDLSSSFSSSYPLSYAFDDNASTDALIENSDGFSVNIDYDFETPTPVNRYTVAIGTTDILKKRAPRTWKIYGSNDGVTWTELDSRDVEVSSYMVSYGPRGDFSFGNDTAYRYYRFAFINAGNAISGNHGANKELAELEYYYKGEGNYIAVENAGLASSDASSISLLNGVEICNAEDITLADTLSLPGFSVKGVIDLNGHDLTLRLAGLTQLAGEGTITDSSTATGRLHVAVASGTEKNMGVSLTGGLRLVKEGTGKLVMTKGAQSYSGGTEVSAGTLAFGVVGSSLPLGVSKSEVLVAKDGTFDLNGFKDMDTYLFTLAGGTIGNYGADLSYDAYKSLTQLKLTADSTFSVSKQVLFGFSDDDTSSNDDAVLDLGGHTLSVGIASGSILRVYNATALNGKIEAAGHGQLLVGGTYGLLATNVDFAVSSDLRVAMAMQVRDYEPRHTGNLNASSHGVLNVYGTFIPTSDYFYGCTMMDGSTIDLSSRANALSLTSAGTAGQTNITFEANATVAVKLGERRVSRSAPIVTWTEETKPSNLSSLKFVRPDDTRIYCISVQSGGLYYAGAGLMIIFQ